MSYQFYPIPAQGRLRELFDYDPESGALVRRETGLPECAVRGNGYLGVWVDGRRFAGHRIIFKLMTGRDPSGVIDHINRVRNDNRWENLRDVTPLENLQNRGWRPARPANQVGAYRAGNRWRSYISHQGKNVYLGMFSTRGEACAAYAGAARLLERVAA